MNSVDNTIQLKQQKLTIPQLPLAIYREIVAHLRQVEGVNSGLIPQTSPEFDYLQSQVGGLWIEYQTDIKQEEKEKERLQQIMTKAQFQKFFSCSISICLFLLR